MTLVIFFNSSNKVNWVDVKFKGFNAINLSSIKLGAIVQMVQFAQFALTAQPIYCNRVCSANGAISYRIAPLHQLQYRVKEGYYG